MELMQASKAWATRPADERYLNIADAYAVAKKHMDSAVERTDVNPALLRAEAVGDDVMLSHKAQAPAKLTNWSFGQLAQMAQAPSAYLRKLPATLAVQNLNHGLARTYGSGNNPTNPDTKLNVLIHSNGSLVVRALNSEKYSRIWNAEILGRMLDFEHFGWRTPVPFEGNSLSWNPCQKCKAGEAITWVEGVRYHGAEKCLNQKEPTIYVSDHDCFIFLVNPNFRIDEPGNPGGLMRGFFIENSEVGAAKFRLTYFYYRDMCCNHIVWGASEVTEVSMRHVGNAHDRMMRQMDAIAVELKRFENTSGLSDEAKVKAARNYLIDATSKDKLLDKLFQMLKGQVTKGALEESYKLAVEHEVTDGNPFSAWGFAQGMTRHSQTIPYADERTKIDRAAGRVLAMAW